MDYILTNDGELYHYGIKGMKWGIRRYQNADGSLTPAGKKRQARQYTKELNKLDKEASEARADVIRSDIRLHKARNKTDKLEGTKRADKAFDKEKESSAKYVQTVRRYQDIVAKNKSRIDEIIAEGYAIKSKDFVRSTKAGEQYAAMYLTSVIGSSIIRGKQIADAGERNRVTDDRGRSYIETPWMVKGSKYKVNGG